MKQLLGPFDDGRLVKMVVVVGNLPMLAFSSSSSDLNEGQDKTTEDSRRHYLHHPS
jgi:hypothetical protein